MSEISEVRDNNVVLISEYKDRVSAQDGIQKTDHAAALENEWANTMEIVEKKILENGFNAEYARKTAWAIIAEARDFRNFLVFRKLFSEPEIVNAQFALIAMRILRGSPPPSKSS